MREAPPPSNRRARLARWLSILGHPFTFTLVLAWARLAMGRHSFAEVAGGAVLGAAVGALTLWL